jgi:hypothetical protein
MVFHLRSSINETPNWFSRMKPVKELAPWILIESGKFWRISVEFEADDLVIAYILLARVHFFASNLWLYSPCGPWPLSQFLNLYKVGRALWTGDQSVARPLPTHRTTQTESVSLFYNMWQRVKIMKLLIMWFSPALYCFLPLRHE